jgi:glutamine synthetase
MRALAQRDVQLSVAFEHEFTVTSRRDVLIEPAFSVRAQRALEPFASHLTAVLGAAGCEPENVLAEYGPHQVEVTVRPCDPMRAADRAVLVRELVREVARLHGLGISFAPVIDPAGVGNGVHVHYSLQCSDGTPMTRGDDGVAGLSAAATAFTAGIADGLGALCAVTAPGVSSYLRLVPHRWSAAYSCVGIRNREATLRICPARRDAGWNVEYRAADACANPHVVIAALMRAGIDGLDAGRGTLPMVDVDPTTLSDETLVAQGIHRLPTSLPEALEEFAIHGPRWFDPLLVETYREMKQTEQADVAGLSDIDLCARYAEVY